MFPQGFRILFYGYRQKFLILVWTQKNNLQLARHFLIFILDFYHQVLRLFVKTCKIINIIFIITGDFLRRALATEGPPPPSHTHTHTHTLFFYFILIELVAC